MNELGMIVAAVMALSGTAHAFEPTPDMPAPLGAQVKLSTGIGTLVCPTPELRDEFDNMRLFKPKGDESNMEVAAWILKHKCTVLPKGTIVRTVKYSIENGDSQYCVYAKPDWTIDCGWMYASDILYDDVLPRGKGK